MFHDARGRQDLRKLLLGGGDDLPGMIEDDRPAGRGALIEGEDVLGHDGGEIGVPRTEFIPSPHRRTEFIPFQLAQGEIVNYNERREGDAR